MTDRCRCKVGARVEDACEEFAGRDGHERAGQMRVLSLLLVDLGGRGARGNLLVLDLSYKPGIGGIPYCMD